MADVTTLYNLSGTGGSLPYITATKVKFLREEESHAGVGIKVRLH